MDSETLLLLSKLQTGAVTILATAGAPTTGTWFTGDITLDSQDVLRVCTAGGSPGTWAGIVTSTLVPRTVSANTTAARGDFVIANGSGLLITAPPPIAGSTFGVMAISWPLSVEVYTPAGVFIGSGIPPLNNNIGVGPAGMIFVSDGTNWVVASGEQDSGWINPILNSPWTFDGAYDSVAYRLRGNTVQFKGVMTGGASGSVAFSVPTYYGPEGLHYQGKLAAYTCYTTGSPSLPVYLLFQYNSTTSQFDVIPTFGGTITDIGLTSVAYTVD